MRVLLAVSFAVTLAVLATTGCRRGRETPSAGLPTPVSAPGGAGGGLAAPEPTPGIGFRLSDADAAGPAPEGPASVAGEPLDDAEVDALLARLPALPETAAVTTTFALRPGPEPPVIAGEDRPAPFPPPSDEVSVPDVAEGALAVERYQPEGDVRLASHLAVTFSQPMVPLTSHETLARGTVPVTLAPEPEGQWRWAGTRTLLFEPELRFPMATEYSVEVPAGLASETGGTLPEPVRFTFRTPPPRVAEFHPGQPRADDLSMPPTDVQPVIFLGFDQAVRAEDVLAHTTAQAGRTRAELRLATDEEIVADETVARLAESFQDHRWVALRPGAPLPAGAVVRIEVGAGMPSAEGPRTTEEAQAFSFRVRDALAVAGLWCSDVEPTDGRRIEGCEPGGVFEVRFNNPLDREAFEPEAVTIDPAVEARVALGSAVTIVAAPVGRTAYTVTLPPDLRDAFGQTLGESVEVVFQTGDAAPALVGPDRSMVVLDPAGPPRLPLLSVNNDALEVALYRVTPDDWVAFDPYLQEVRDPEREAVPPGRPAWTGVVEPEGERDRPVSVSIDLAPALQDGLGQVVAVVAPRGWSPEDESWRSRPLAYWVQVTRIGLTVLSDGRSLAVWATDLADGAPLAGVDVALEPDGGQAVTDRRGLAALEAVAATFRGWPEPGGVVARLGSDLSFAPRTYGGHWAAVGRDTALAWYAFDDRGLYRPGETARVKGWIRRLEPAPDGDLEPLAGGPEEVAYLLTAPNGQEVISGTAAVDTWGGFDLALGLPAEIELGSASLRLTARGGDLPAGSREAYREIRIAEFRRPEFDVTVTPAPETFVAGDPAVVTARGAYFAGGPLAAAPVSWYVTGRATSYAPPGHDTFTFGTTPPWWRLDGPMPTMDIWPPPGPDATRQHEGVTDASGEHAVAIDLTHVEPVAPVAFQAEASIQDVNRQTWTGSASLLVHPASVYVGLRPDRWFAEADEPFAIDAIVPDVDGRPIAGTRIRVRAERVTYVQRAGAWEEDLVPAGSCDLTSAPEPVTCTLAFAEPGEHRVTAEVADAAGRPNRSVVTLHVAGAIVARPRGLEGDRVDLVPDAERYEPGDTASVLVVAPFGPAEGLMTIDRGGIVRTERFRVADGSATLSVPIEEPWLPEVFVRVDLVGSAPRTGPDGGVEADLPERPAFASGTVVLAVSPAPRTLDVNAAPAADAVEPGSATRIEVTVTDDGGAPVADAGVALVVVDEAILALTGYEVPDPIEALYGSRGQGVSVLHQRELVVLTDPSALRAPGTAVPPPPATGGGDGRGMVYGLDRAEAMPSLAVAEAAAMDMAEEPDAPPAPALRADLEPLAAFVPDLRTDADGRATAEIELPDNVTRYRVTAVATDGARRFGKGEATLVARLPIVVRPSLPRFLNFGDVAEMPVVVQNQTDADTDVSVVLRAANLRLTGPRGLAVTVPANDRVEVRFPAEAALPGTAVVQAAAFGAAAADAQQVELPVWTPATTEAFATYGEIDEGAAAQPLVRPDDAIPAFGGLEVQTSSTALAELTDAYLYLQSYPFEGAEQVASRLMATVALEDVLAAFGAADMPSPTEVDGAIRRDVERLVSLQSGDGGWRWWPGSPDTDPFLSVHVAHALARAREAGHDVPEPPVDQALRYMEDIAAHLDHAPGYYGPEARRAVRAYALYARLRLGDPQPEAARSLLAESDEHSVETLGWLLTVLSGDAASGEQRQEIRRQLANRVSEEASTAQFATDYDEVGGNLILASDRRADAVVLEALIEDEPESSLIPKLARGLLAHRTRGRWGSTQENAFVLLALDRYFRAYEGVTPDFVARAWLGDGFLGDWTFEGRSPDRGLLEVPMATLPEGETDLVLQKDGAGRLYYRLGLRYAPRDLDLAPLERGFSVERTYEAVDDPADVRRTADGTWEVRSGARVRVRLTMVAPARRYQVALVDPLPAGLEALNPWLATTGTLPPEEPGDGPVPFESWWYGRWYEHDAFRDERVEAFARLLEPGVHTYDYVARATTPGTFQVPPPRAEEMYHPETFGRGASEVVRVR